MNFEYIKGMRINAWNAYFECLELIDNIEIYGSEIDKLRINILRKRLRKLAENSQRYDTIYAVIYDPFYALPKNWEI